jgi:3-oxoacyl-[acyl-carrier protein] reductase
MELGLTGRRVLVTGATRGIGRSVAQVFAAEGARVALTYHSDEAAAKQLADELGAARDRALAVRYALDDPESIDEAVGTVRDRWGGVDVLVANALHRGPRRPPTTHFEDVPVPEWEPLVRHNLAGTLRTAHLVTGDMRRNGWGRIVFVSSHVARDGQRGQEFYSAAKAALHGVVRSLSWDVGPDGILANVVSPGLTTTEGVLTVLPAPVRERETALTATGRLAAPEDIATTVVFLCSAANRAITGENLTVAGGR